MKSKTKIRKQTEKKINPEVVETIKLCNKSKEWKEIAAILSGSRKNYANINLNQIKKDVVVPGKVLSSGESGKHKVVALAFSEKAKEKIEKAGGKALTILDELKLNKTRKGLEILK